MKGVTLLKSIAPAVSLLLWQGSILGTSLGAGAVDSQPKCLGTATLLGLKPNEVDISRNYRHQLSFCRAYDINSCCRRNMTDMIRLKMWSGPPVSSFFWQRGLTSACYATTQEALCGACDPIAGTAAAAFSATTRHIEAVREDKRVPLCRSHCEHWYNSCSTSWFGRDTSQRLVPCQETSLLCWKPDKETPESFCSQFGFAVVDDGVEEYCFSPGATSGVSILGPGAKPPEYLKWAKDFRELLINAIDQLAWVIQRGWRRMNAMAIWLTFIAAIWITSHTRKAPGVPGMAPADEDSIDYNSPDEDAFAVQRGRSAHGVEDQPDG